MVKSILNRRRRTKKKLPRKRGGSAVTAKAPTESLITNDTPAKENQQKATEHISTQDEAEQKTIPNVETEPAASSSLKSLAVDATSSAAKLSAVASNPEIIIANDAADTIADITNNDGGYAPFSPAIWGTAIQATGNVFKKGYHIVSDTINNVKETAKNVVETAEDVVEDTVQVAEGIGAVVAKNAIKGIEDKLGVDLDNTKPEAVAEELTDDVNKLGQVGEVLAESEEFKKTIGKAAEVTEKLGDVVLEEAEKPIKEMEQKLVKTGTMIAEDAAIDAVAAIPGVGTAAALTGEVMELARTADMATQAVQDGKEVVENVKETIDKNKKPFDDAVKGVTDVVKDAQKKVEEAEAKAATQVKIPEIPKIQTPQISTAAATAGGGRKKRRSTRKKLRRSAKKSMSRVTKSLRKFLRSN